KNVNFLQYHFKELSNYNIANSIDILQEKEGHLDFVIIPHYTFLDYYKHLSYNSIYHKSSTYGKYIAVDAFIKKINEAYDKVKSKCNDIKNDLIATIKKLEHPYDINNKNRAFKKMMDEYNTKKKKLIKCIKNHENDFNKICMDMKNYGTNLFEQLSCYNNNFCNTNGIRYHYDEYIHKLILSVKSKNLNKDLSDMTNILQQSELLLTNLNKKMGSYIYIDTIKFIHKEMKHIFNRIEYHTKIINDKTKIIQDKIKLNIWRTFQKDELLKRILDMSNEYSLFITSDHLRQMLYNTFYSKEKHLNNIFHHLIYVLQMKFNDVPIKMEYFQTYKKNKPLTQ
uniref:Reticulocyte-binding protein homolog 5 n=1 Tax=Plasmodium falciparum (isolate 3D7) TaxID=36329 RepID=UPI000DC066BF